MKPEYRRKASELVYGVVCPTCAGPKREQSSQCWACWIERRRGEAYYEARTCSCGGPKSVGYVKCLACEHERRRANPEAWDFAVPPSKTHPWRRSMVPTLGLWGSG